LFLLTGRNRASYNKQFGVMAGDGSHSTVVLLSAVVLPFG